MKKLLSNSKFLPTAPSNDEFVRENKDYLLLNLDKYVCF